MSAQIQEFRSQLCLSLLQAGVHDAQNIVTTAAALEQYVFGQDKQLPIELPTVVQTAPQETATEQPVAKSEKTAAEKPAPKAEAPIQSDVTRADVLDAAKQLAANKGKTAVFEVLEAFNAKTVTTLKDEQLADALAAFKKAA